MPNTYELGIISHYIPRPVAATLRGYCIFGGLSCSSLFIFQEHIWDIV